MPNTAAQQYGQPWRHFRPCYDKVSTILDEGIRGVGKGKVASACVVSECSLISEGSFGRVPALKNSYDMTPSIFPTLEPHWYAHPVQTWCV